ncbi:MAG: phage holin family protein [bacterium]
MQPIIIQILILTFAIILTSYLLPGITIKSFWTAVLVALVLALLNAFVKPLMVFLTIPVTLWYFGLFLFVINALIILLAGALVKGFEVRGFWWALLFSIILSLIQYLLEYLILPSFA